MTEEPGWVDVGERVRQARLALGMSQSELAGSVGLDRTMIVKIEAGTRRIDALELVRLSSTLDVPMAHLLHPRPRVLSRRGTPLAEDTETHIGRESQRVEVVLAAWLRDVRQLRDLGYLRPPPILTYAGRVESEDDARSAALWTRQELGCADGPIWSLLEFSERAGQYALVTDLPGDGASLLDGGLAAAVVSRHDDPGRRRATAAHELGHLVLGDEYSSDLGVHASRAEREAVIDAFAAELLLPTTVVLQADSGGRLTRDGVVRLAARHRTSWTLALRQAQHAGVIDDRDRQRWSQSRPTRAEFLEAIGWAPQPDLDSMRVPPGYAHAVMTAWREGAIADDRAVELMHGQLDVTDLPVRDDADGQP